MANLSEKYNDIRLYITQHGDVKVYDLTQRFGISEATVRRVLSAFAGEGLVHRYHGGAYLVDPESLSPVKRRQVSHQAEKAAIGQLAATMVADGMTLLLLGGTSVHALCPYLNQNDLTVITNSLPVVNALNWKENIKLVVLGGILNPMELEMRGALTEHSLKSLRADLLFMGTTGFHLVHGVMTDDPNAVNTYAQCIKMCDNIYVLADNSKFTHPTGILSIAKPQDITAVFSDDALPDSFRQACRKANLSLYIASPGTLTALDSQIGPLGGHYD